MKKGVGIPFFCSKPLIAIKSQKTIKMLKNAIENNNNNNLREFKDSTKRLKTNSDAQLSIYTFNKES